MRAYTLLLSTLVLLVADRSSAATATEVRIEPYKEGLRSITVEAAGAKRRFLLDTGAGITTITPEVARALGCAPYGRLTGYRMSGERMDLARCDGVSLRIGGVSVTPSAVGVFDVMSKLPPDWPRLDGVIGLNAFDRQQVTLDLAAGRLIVGEPTRTRSPAAREVLMREDRPVGGGALGVFVAVKSPRGPLWFELDSGNTGPVLVAKHNAGLLGLDPKGGKAIASQLVIEGAGKLSGDVVLQDLILDGNIGLPQLSRWVMTIDFVNHKLWVEDAPASPTRRARTDAEPGH